jgi:hypothetical protein
VTSQIRFNLGAVGALFLSSCFSSAAFGMSYVPIADEALADPADAIVIGQVIAHEPMPGQPLDAQRYRLRVDRVVKGAVGSAEIAVRQPGAFDPDAPGALTVPGAVHLEAGERTLLLLNARADGSYDVAQMALGAFHVRTTVSGEQVLVRDLSESEVAEGVTAKSAQLDRLRNLDRFAGWLRARNAGQAPSADYWSDARPSDVVTPKYALYAAPPPRWFEFDNGGSITIYGGPQGQVGLSGGGYGALQAAINAWDNDSGSNVRYVYGGVTNATGGLSRTDGVNEVLFNDPNGDIAGSYDCNGGGIVAMSSWRSGGTRQLNGRTFKTIVEVDTVVQDGAGCVMAENANGPEVLAHELGHTLGLAHPCGDAGLVSCLTNALLNDALMRPYIHGDGRGASLRADDLAGIAFLYPKMAVSAPPPAPAAGAGGSNTSSSSSGSGGGAMELAPLIALLLIGLVSASPVLRPRRSALRANDRRRAADTSRARRRA